MELTLGNWAEKGLQIFMEKLGTPLEKGADFLESFIQSFLSLLESFTPWVLIVAFTLLSFLIRRRIALSLAVMGGLFLILHLGFWKEMLATGVLVILATFISTLVGIPLGIVAAKRPWLYRVLHPLLDLMQTIPTFVYLIPTLMIFGLGVVPGVVSTVIFALPAPIRLTYLGIKNVPSHLVEVAHSFGANSWQLLWKTELPHARPMIFAGITQCIMLSLSMVVIAALVGADGLGRPVVQALNTVNLVKGFEAGFSIVIMAILLDRLLKLDLDGPLRGGPEEGKEGNE